MMFRKSTLDLIKLFYTPAVLLDDMTPFNGISSVPTTCFTCNFRQASSIRSLGDAEAIRTECGSG